MNMARENSHLVTDYQGLSPHGGSNVDGASIPKAGDVVGPIGSTAETNTSISSAPQSSHLGSPREQEQPILKKRRKTPAQLGQIEVFRGIYCNVPSHVPTLTKSHIIRRVSMKTFGRMYGHLRGDFKSNEEFYEAYKRAALREEAGLPEDVIRSCLRMKKHNAASRFNSNELACADDEENHKLCSICMVGYESGDEIGMLWYCAHEYHADCLKKWLVKKNTCPCCRGLALIPPWFEDWKGKDLRAHQLFFEQFLTGKMI